MRSLAAALSAADRHRVLERLSLVYIALPFLVFVVGWLRPWFAIPCALVTLVGLYRAQLPTESGPVASTMKRPV